MPQRTVERVIGRLVTDEELRLDFTRAPKETLAASDAAARMDPRLQRSEAHLDQQVLDSLLGKERSQYYRKLIAYVQS